MLWLAGEVFLLCLLSFLAGAAVTAVALRRKPAPVQPGEVIEEDLEPVAALPEDPEVEVATRTVLVKATKKSMRYHTPESPYYNRVKGDLTFTSAEEAELAGYTAWNKTTVKS